MPDYSAETYWSCPADELLERSRSCAQGLSDEEASSRRALIGANVIAAAPEQSIPRVLARQFRSPLVLVLVVASAIAGLVRDWAGTIIIVAVVVSSATIGFLQEYRAASSLRALQRRLAATCPSRALLASTATVLILALIFVQLPAGAMLGLPRLPVGALLLLAAITVAYIASVEALKRRLSAPYR